jgi:dihydropteroate synthase
MNDFLTALHAPGRHPIVMGVLNVTPDSFSDGGRWLDPSAAVDHARRLIGEGAGIVDVFGFIERFYGPSPERAQCRPRHRPDHAWDSG